MGREGMGFNQVWSVFMIYLPSTIPHPHHSIPSFFLLGCSGSTDIHSPERLLSAAARTCSTLTHLRSKSAMRESLTEKSERKFFDSMTRPKSAIMII